VIETPWASTHGVFFFVRKKSMAVMGKDDDDDARISLPSTNNHCNLRDFHGENL
jgi:hypothetical protein